MGMAGIFLLLVIAVAAALTALYVFLTMYVYHDAKIRSGDPLVWLLIALFVPSFFGFIVYFLVGRKKNVPSDHKYRLPVIISAVVLAATLVGTGATVVLSGDVPLLDNVSIGMVEDNIGSHWNVSYITSGERLERTLNLTAEEKAAFTAEGSCSEGRVYMLMVQGSNVLLTELTDRAAAPVDLSAFSDGKISITLYNENARDAVIKLNWQS